MAKRTATATAERVAARHDPGGVGVPLYSPIPPEHDAPEVAIAAGKRSWHADRQSYPALPWTMAELVGSRWRNLPTGREVRIERVGPDEHPARKGFVAIWTDYDLAGPTGWASGIGFWCGERGDRYIVEHWARVDHLPPAVQLRWFAVEVAAYQSHIARLEASIRRHSKGSCDAANRTCGGVMCRGSAD